MCPQKVLQVIPDRKRTAKHCVLNLLIVVERKPQLIRQLLLCHSRGLPGRP